MKRSILYCLLAIFLLPACNKAVDSLINKGSKDNRNQFIKYTILQGQQFCDQNVYRSVETSAMKFTVKFDSSAIYKTQSTENQYDINKLYGFSDNNSDHHQFSARIGWRWSDEALRLFAYVYNNGQVSSKEITTINIGSEINCSIQVAGTNYLFTVNGVTLQVPRLSTTDKGSGYQLYPYFGGDETAPHDVRIWVRED